MHRVFMGSINTSNILPTSQSLDDQHSSFNKVDTYNKGIEIQFVDLRMIKQALHQHQVQVLKLFNRGMYIIKYIVFNKWPHNGSFVPVKNMDFNIKLWHQIPITIKCGFKTQGYHD